MKKSHFIILAVLFLISACSPSTKTFGNADKWLPPGFDAKNEVVLIQKISWPRRQQSIMEEYMKEKYPYQYEFFDGDPDKDSKFADTNKYRYVLFSTSSSHVMHANDPSRHQVAVGMSDFYFYDRTTQKSYPATGKGSSWASVTFKPIINTILARTKAAK